MIAHKAGHGPGWATVDGSSRTNAGTITLPRAAGLDGTVRDVKGQLLCKVTVRAEELTAVGAPLRFGSAAAPAWAKLRTDGQGRFRFLELPAGAKVKLDISTCGAEEGYREDEMAPELGEIALAKPRTDVAVRLVSQPVIEGTLLGPDQKPAAGVKVMLRGPIKGQPHSFFDHSDVTDGKGHYRFVLTVAGTWTLSVTDTKYADVLAKDLKVDLGQHITLPTKVLQASAVIQGRVLDAGTGAPVAGVLVTCNSLQPVGPPGPATNETGMTTGLDGRFEVGGPSGKAVLSLGGPPAGYTWNHVVTKGTGGEHPVKVVDDPKKPSMRLLTLKPGQALAGMDLFVTREAEVTGVVLGPDGSPRRPKGFDQGGYVWGHLDSEHVTASMSPPLGHRVEQDGTFSLRYVFADVPCVFTVGDKDGGLGGGVCVTPKLAAPNRVTIRLSPMATITGRALMPDGSPAVGAAVGSFGAITDHADAAGRFVLKRGIVGLPMRVDVYQPACPRDGKPGAWPTHHGQSEPFEIRPGEKTRDLGDIVLKAVTRRTP